MARIDTHRAAYNRPNPSLRCGKVQKPKPQVKTASTSKLYMMLAPFYTNNKSLLPIKPEELSEARKIYPKGKFIRITEVKTTTYEVL